MPEPRVVRSWDSIPPVVWTDPTPGEAVSLRVLEKQYRDLETEIEPLREMQKQIRAMFGSDVSISVSLMYIQHWKKVHDAAVLAEKAQDGLKNRLANSRKTDEFREKTRTLCALTKGEKVITLADTHPTDYHADARKNCKWGEEGIVIKVSNSHGLCYQVLHEDGTRPWYEPDELRPK